MQLTVVRVGTAHLGLHGEPAREAVVEALKHVPVEGIPDWFDRRRLRACPPALEVREVLIGGGALMMRGVTR